MIGIALNTIVEELNAFFTTRTGNTDVVVLDNLLTQTGAITTGVDGHIVASLMNLEEDRISRPLDIYRKQANGRVETVNPEIRLNLYILFIANFVRTTVNTDGYQDGLTTLSNVVRFFQKKPYFNHSNTPGLDTNIEKLVIELYTLSFEQTNHLWGSLGAKYMPSVMYKVRLVSLQENELISEGPPITEIDINSSDSNL